MSRRTCPCCEGRSVDGHLCKVCVDKTTKALHRTVELWPDLWDTISRQARLQAASEGHAINGSRPLDFEYDAAELANEIRHTLVAWTKLSIDEYRAPCPADRISGMAHHLANWMPRLRTHVAARDMVAELCAFPVRIWWAVDPEQWSRIKFGPCPETTEDGEPCPGVVFGVVPKSEDASPFAICKREGEAKATVCGRQWPATEWTRLGGHIAARAALIDAQKARARKADDDAVIAYMKPPEWLGPREFITIADAAHIYSVPRSTLDRWVRDGKIPSYSVTGLPNGKKGRPILSVVSAADVAKRHADLLLDKAGERKS